MVAFVVASGNVSWLNIPFGRQVRWIVLVELCAVALVYVLVRRKSVRLGAPEAIAALLLGLAFVSALWSPDAEQTAIRAASLLLLLVTAAAIGLGAAGRPEHASTILLGLLGGVAVVAVGGIVELLLWRDDALVPATTQSPVRYTGLGANPNSTAIVLALGLPLACWALLEARSRRGRACAAALLLLFAGSLVASGSRGALLGGFAGLAALALAVARERRLRIRLLGACVAAFALSVVLMQLPQPAETNPPLDPSLRFERPISPQDAQFLLPLESEVGFPSPHATAYQRSLFDSSGRTPAWRGAVDQVRQRPLLGYGFGMEERVFVDRFYLFYSSLVENSYLGTVIQLGPLGLALLVALIGVPLAGAWRALPRLAEPDRRVLAACAGAVVCGVVLAATQSFLTSVGSTVAAAFWLCALMLGPAAAAGRARRA